MATSDLRHLGRTRFARQAYVVLDVFPEIMQELVKKSVDSTAMHYLIKRNPLLKTKLSYDEMNILPTLLTDGYTKCDTILLYKLIRQQLPTPGLGWGKAPLVSNLGISDDVERIRIARNKFVHRSNADVSEKEEEEFFQEFENVARRIDTYLQRQHQNLFESKLKSWRQTSIDLEQEESYISRAQAIEGLKLMSTDNSSPDCKIHIYMAEKVKMSIEQNDSSDQKEMKIVVTGILDEEKIIAAIEVLKAKLNQNKYSIVMKDMKLGSVIIYVTVFPPALKSVDIFCQELFKFLHCILTHQNATCQEINAVALVFDELLDNDYEELWDHEIVKSQDEFEYDPRYNPDDLILTVNVDRATENQCYEKAVSTVRDLIETTKIDRKQINIIVQTPLVDLDKGIKETDVKSTEETRMKRQTTIPLSDIVRNKSTIAKIDRSVADLCKGEDKKRDAMILMSSVSNWDQFLTPAPCAIALLGGLILISADTDFSLEVKPPKDGFKLLRYPGSFRASLVQVSNAGWSAFNEAHTSMDQIRLHSENVDGHVKNAVRFLMQGTNAEVEKMLPMSMRKIQDIADESLKLAKAIEDRFIGVMELTGELLEACTNTKGQYDEKTKETEIAIKVAKTKRESRQKEIEESERRLANMEKEVKEAQNDFKQALDNVPSGASLLAISAGEALIEGVRNITSFPKMVKKAVVKKLQNVSAEDDSDERNDMYLNTELSKQAIYKQVTTINKHIHLLIEIVSGKTDGPNSPSPDWGKISEGELKVVSQSLDMCRLFVSQQTASGDLCDRVLKVCDEGISVCDTLHRLSKSMAIENRDELISDVVQNTNRLRKEIQTMFAEASRSLGNNPLDTKSPHISKMPTESGSASAVKAAVENARYKTELAKETLKDAKRRQEKAADELRESNEKLTQALRDMAKLDLKKIDFDTIRETLVKGIKALAEVREQWGKLVRFFQMLSNLIKCCLHSSLTDFVDLAHEGRTLKMTDHTVPLSNIFRDVIFEQASKASQIAYIVRTIAGTYVQISNEHLMDRITCLGRLVALDPKKDEHEITRRREELHNGCEAAQKAIRDIIIKEKEEFNRKVDERINKIIEMEKTLPAIPPEREREIQESISAGIQFSEEELDDLV